MLKNQEQAIKELTEIVNLQDSKITNVSFGNGTSVSTQTSAAYSKTESDNQLTPLKQGKFDINGDGTDIIEIFGDRIKLGDYTGQLNAGNIILQANNTKFEVNDAGEVLVNDEIIYGKNENITSVFTQTTPPPSGTIDEYYQSLIGKKLFIGSNTTTGAITGMINFSGANAFITTTLVHGTEAFVLQWSSNNPTKLVLNNLADNSVQEEDITQVQILKGINFSVKGGI